LIEALLECAESCDFSSVNDVYCNPALNKLKEALDKMEKKNE